MTTEEKDKNPITPLSEDGVSDYLHMIRGIPLLTPEEELSLAKRCAAGDQEAIRQMVNANLRLVVSVAKEHGNKGVPLLDLIQEGSIGLIEAAKRFDYTRNNRFSTYAMSWIRQGVIQGLIQHKNMIKVSSYASERIKKVLRARMQIKEELGVEPTVEEIAAVCGLPEDKVEKYLQISSKTKSLNTRVGEDEDTDLIDLIEDDHALKPQKEFVRKELKKTLEELLSMLDERQQMVLKMHFGMEDNVGCSLEDISMHFGVSKERIRQIEQQAMAKLKRYGANFGLEDFLYE